MTDTVYPVVAEAAPFIHSLLSILIPLLIIALASIGLVAVVSQIIDIFTTVRLMKNDMRDFRKELAVLQRALDDLRFRK